MKRYFVIGILVALFFGGPVYVLITGEVDFSKPWWDATRKSAKIAPDPKLHKDSIVQIYIARAYGWRGLFGVHSWISVKKKNQENYTVYQVIGWKAYGGLPVVNIAKDFPDRIWYGNEPEIIFDARGDKAQEIIQKMDEIVEKYPYHNRYRFWPGPNSNTFVAYVVRNIPQINIRLPVTAIGKDYLVDTVLEKSVSKTGYQFSLRGLFGLTIAKEEGVELNILSFSFSVNKIFPYIHLPGID